jgi:hypothetical protein
VGANAADFSRTTTCDSTLAAGANCTVSISFLPTAAQRRRGRQPADGQSDRDRPVHGAQCRQK